MYVCIYIYIYICVYIHIDSRGLRAVEPARPAPDCAEDRLYYDYLYYYYYYYYYKTQHNKTQQTR